MPEVRRLTSIAVVLIGTAALVVLVIGRTHSRAIELTTFFQNGDALRSGAAVRVAGVDVGYVKTVRVRPELRENPVQVIMRLNPPYTLSIPQDATVSLATAGVLGETFVEIDIHGTSGPPLEKHGVIRSRPSPELPTSADFIKHLQELLAKKGCSDSPPQDQRQSRIQRQRKSNKLPLQSRSPLARFHSALLSSLSP